VCVCVYGGTRVSGSFPPLILAIKQLLLRIHQNGTLGAHCFENGNFLTTSGMEVYRGLAPNSTLPTEISQCGASGCVSIPLEAPPVASRAPPAVYVYGWPICTPPCSDLPPPTTLLLIPSGPCVPVPTFSSTAMSIQVSTTAAGTCVICHLPHTRFVLYTALVLCCPCLVFFLLLFGVKTSSMSRFADVGT
jgi:hypothetical protein